MRSDMYKVIVERPRKHKSDYVRAARLRNDMEGPARLGMRAGYGHLWLNENLAPLRRFLMQQVGRPWNKVQSEISECIDRRNTVQQHIHQHIDDFIATQVAWRDDELIDLENCWQSPFGNGALRQPLYVDPRTGLIRPNKKFRSWRQDSRAAALRERDEVAARRRVLGQDRLLLLLNGQWFEVQFASLPEIEHKERMVRGKLHLKRADRPVFDVVLKQNVCRRAIGDAAKQEYFYGAWDRYAVSKRQLSKREMVAHGLRAEPK